MIVGEREFFTALPRLIWHEDEPIAHPSSVPLYFVSALARSHVKVVLTGEGSDELLAGYGRYPRALLNWRLGRLYDAAVPAAIRAPLGRWASRLDPFRRRIEAAFYQEDCRYFALAIDGQGRRVSTLSSNPGHLLWSGAVSDAQARAIATRLLSEEMYSGWGIRTVARGQAVYNPISYHTGAVWPHDNALIAAGLKRNGFDTGANQLAGRLIESAAFSPVRRLPELFCGFDRTATPVPVPNPVACSPQAWAAGSVFLFLRALLGMTVVAPKRKVEFRPARLPPYLQWVEIRGLRVGDASVDLLLERRENNLGINVGSRQGDVRIVAIQ